MSKQVIIYSTPTCNFCRSAKIFFSENKIAFTEFNVAKDEIKAIEMFDKTGQTAVPVIDVDGKIIIGYDRQALKAALDLK